MNDRSGLSLAPADLTRADAPPQPVEVGPGPSFAGFSDPGQAGFAELQSFASARTGPGPGGNGGRLAADPLALWYSANDSPWIPGARYELPRQKNRPSQRAVGPPPNAFTTMRGGAAASDCDTAPGGVPSDSGYASAARPSVGRPSVGYPSVFGDADRSAETQSLVGNLADFSISPDGTQYPWGPVPDSQSEVGANGLWCEWCKKALRTKSEKK